MIERVVYLGTTGGAWLVFRTAQKADLEVMDVGNASDADVAREACRTLIAWPSANAPHRVSYSALGQGKQVNLYARGASVT